MELGQVRYSPEHGVPMICHNPSCDAELEPFSFPQVIPGSWEAPGRVALLCDACSRLFWERENEIARLEEEYWSRGTPS